MALKGMNSQYITSLEDCDYRFLSLLLVNIFKMDELAEGCVKMASSSSQEEDQSSTAVKYKRLDQKKFDFVKGEFF